MQKCFKGLLKPRCFEIGKSRLLEMEKALYSRPKGNPQEDLRLLLSSVSCEHEILGKK